MTMRHAHTMLAAILLMCSIASPAYAIFNISTPGVKEGQASIEFRNRWDTDHRTSKDDYHAHLFKAEYGFTPWLSAEVSGKMERTASGDWRYAATEPEVKFHLTSEKEYWLESAVKFGYEIVPIRNSADKAKAKLLLEKNFGAWNHVANINFSQEVGDDSTRDLSFDYSWRTKYRWLPYLEPGIEYYGNVGELSNTGTWDDQRHRIGPMFFGQIAPGLKYQAGYLVGISGTAEDGSWKFFLKYDL